jgi:phage shock protein C
MRKLYRSQSDKKISGVCGGLASWLGIDANILRLIALATALFSFGSIILFYLLAVIIVPKEPFGTFSDNFNY